MIPGIFAGGMIQGVVPISDFPEPLSSTSTNFTSQTTTHLANMPATVDSGDLLVALVASAVAEIVSAPSGWTSEGSLNEISNVRLTVHRKIADGSEGGTTVNFVTTNSRRMGVIVYRIQAGTFNPATPIALQFGTTGGSSAPNPPSLSPSWGSKKTLWIAAFAAQGSASDISGYPYTDGNSSAFGGSGATTNTSCKIAACWAKIETSTEDPGAFTMGASANSVPATIAVQPA